MARQGDLGPRATAVGARPATAPRRPFREDAEAWCVKAVLFGVFVAPFVFGAYAYVAYVRGMELAPVSAWAAPALRLPVRVGGDGSVVLCDVDYAAYRNEPSRFPFFSQMSRNCDKATYLLRSQVLAFDAAADKTRLALVFHSSRCGSTLVGNMLAASRGHRVVSEPRAVEQALQTGDDAVLRAVVKLYAAGATPGETLVLKLAPQVALAHFATLLRVFPDAPYLFLYRDPGATLHSLLRQNPLLQGVSLPAPVAQLYNWVRGRAMIAAPCLEAIYNPHPEFNAQRSAVAARLAARPPGRKAGDVDFCAAWLAAICTAALDASALAGNGARGLFLEYDAKRLADDVLDSVVPHFRSEAPGDDAAAMRRAASHYSKAGMFTLSKWSALKGLYQRTWEPRDEARHHDAFSAATEALAFPELMRRLRAANATDPSCDAE